MSLSPGARIGSYDVVAAIGAGAMGEVFRARDRSLHRDVAIKLLPPALASDDERRARFAREARLLAALNHPHVAQVYGVEDSVAGPAIVMELVEGRTLGEILRDPELARRDALELARQIALALDAAHEKGIVHRDLKPANIKVTPEGTLKVLDFGLAKMLAVEDPHEGPALTTVATRHGAVLGTPAYMSPEQARGLPVDRRADIWAFGCLLYELLAGRHPFGTATTSDTIVAILGREPDWDALHADTPPGVRSLIRWCLEKDRRRRLRDIGDAIPYLTDASDGAWSASATPAGGSRAIGSRGVSVAATLAFAAAALAVGVMADRLLVRGGGGATPSAGRTPVRFSLPPPAGSWFGSQLADIETTRLAFSPDGSQLAFIATGRSGPPQVWVRPLAEDEARPVQGTDGAISVFWSPDGRSLGFFAGGKLKRIDLAGGPAAPICDVPANIGLSGSWGAGGVILFASVQGDGISRVSAVGGTPAPARSTPDFPVHRRLWPRFLPDGRRFVYTEIGPDYQARIFVVDANGGERPILAATSHAQWVDPDWLVFVREGTLLGQRVDLEAGAAIGEPVPIMGPIAYSAATGWSDVAASPNGMLAVQSHVDVNRVVWIDRTGRELESIGVPGGYFTVRLSPDGSTLLFARLRPELGTYDLWTADLARKSEMRVTSSPGMETGETWLPGGREVVFAAAEGGPPNLFHKDLVTGIERRLQTASRFQFPNDVSPDGATVVYQQRTELGSWDLMEMSLAHADRVTPLFSTPFSETELRFAPSGRTVAFVSDESGRSQVYVAPFPPTGVRTAVSSDGGSNPRWRGDGRELVYLSGAGQLMAVPVDASGAPGTPRALFDASAWRDFDVAPDGQRFVVVVPVKVAREQPLSVILNWPQAVGR